MLSKCASLVTQNYLEGKRMNKEYLIAKADLCKDLAIEQISNGDSEAGVENLKRMIKALEEINFINYLEEKRGRE
jgi:nucleoid-associated protein YejK